MRRVTAAACLALVTACGSDVVEPEAGECADLRPHAGQQVTVTAEVAGLQSPQAFTIVGQETGSGEPLLGAEDTARLVQYDGQPYIDADSVTADEPA